MRNRVNVQPALLTAHSTQAEPKQLANEDPAGSGQPGMALPMVFLAAACIVVGLAAGRRRRSGQLALPQPLLRCPSDCIVPVRALEG